MPKGQIKQKQSKISQKQFESMCQIQCTQEEICSILDVDHKTLDRWCNSTYGKKFSQIFQEKRQGGKCSLRRKQWKLADTNATMAIFLGKQYLGQKDQIEENHSFNNGVLTDLLGALKDAKKD